MPNDTDTLLKKRQTMRMAIDVLAEALPEDLRAAFVGRSVARMNERFPAPSPRRMRSYLKLHTN